jgi:hypothetical protein
LFSQVRKSPCHAPYCRSPRQDRWGAKFRLGLVLNIAIRHRDLAPLGLPTLAAVFSLLPVSGGYGPAGATMAERYRYLRGSGLCNRYLVTWPWGASLHRKVKQQRDHSGRSLKAYPRPSLACPGPQMEPNFSPAASQRRRPRRTALASMAHKVVCAISLQGLVVALGRSTAHWPVPPSKRSRRHPKSAPSPLSFDHSDPKRYWPLSMMNERALKLSPNPRVTNSSRALAGLRRRGLVKGYYGHYPSLRLTTAGVKMRASLTPQLPLRDSEKPVDSFCTLDR